MKYFKVMTISLSLFFAGLNFSGVSAVENASATQLEKAANQTWTDVVDYAREHLPSEGHLLMKSDGFVYLKVDDDYIHALFPMLGLEEEGYKEPPYFRSAGAPGAHISVFYENEHVYPDEVGQKFHFELKEIVIVRPSRTTSYAVLQVESPELEQLRLKYGLSPKLHGYEYHISLAKKTTR